MEFDDILTAAAGREAAEKIGEEMKKNGMFLSRRENLDLRYDKVKAQRDALLAEKNQLALQLAHDRESFGEALQLRQKKLEQTADRLRERCVAEEIGRVHAKNPALVRALVMPDLGEPDTEGAFPGLTEKLEKLMQDEPYLFEGEYTPAGSESEVDPAGLTDAEYFARLGDKG